MQDPMTMIAGAAGFIAPPVRRFDQLRTEVVQSLVNYGNVPARINERGRITEGFTEADAAQVKEAKNAFRQLGAQMLAYAARGLVSKLVASAFRCDPVKAGRA